MELQTGVTENSRLVTEDLYIRSRHGAVEGELIPSCAFVYRIYIFPYTIAGLAVHRFNATLCIRVEQDTYIQRTFCYFHYIEGGVRLTQNLPVLVLRHHDSGIGSEFAEEVGGHLRFSYCRIIRTAATVRVVHFHLHACHAGRQGIPADGPCAVTVCSSFHVLRNESRSLCGEVLTICALIP